MTNKRTILLENRITPDKSRERYQEREINVLKRVV